MVQCWLVLWALLSQASAGSGPWVLGKGDEQVYIGADYQRFNRLAIDDGAYTDTVIRVDQGVSSFGGVVVGALGLARRIEIEAELPYRVNFVEEQGAVCELLALDACARTHGVGVVVARSKFLVVDELAGPPVSFAIGLDLRFGMATANRRERITSLGEGTFDIEPRISLGRIGSFKKGNGFWSAFFDVGWRYRVPIDVDYTDDGINIPGWELTGNVEALFAPVPLVSFGPSFAFLWRPNGVDFSATDLTDPNRLVGLRIFAADLGGKIIFRNGRNVSVSASVFHTLYAINNPQDVIKVGVGVSIRDLFRKRED